MKRFFLFLVVFIFIGGAIFANPVDKNQAKQVALNYYSYRASIPKTEVKISKTEAYKYEGDVVFYIYSIKNGGFVIVSADDAAKPILGYSVSNEIKNYKENEVISDWLKSYAEQIVYIRAKKLDNSVTLLEWNNILIENYSKATKAVTPLLTTTWDQEGAYNDLCPSNTPTGCVATAMAQVMKYHNYPTTGVSQHQYNHATYGVQSASFKSTTYDWASMPDASGNTAVATLMYHCGVSVDMNYAPDGSGSQTTWVPYAMANYFKYDQSIKYDTIGGYTNAGWISLLKTELDASRPMIYSGSGSSGGHAFVCDGYNSSDEFHFNWGWSGYYNGYYAIGSLNPGSDDFNDDNAVVMNIKPATTPKFYAVRKFSDLSNACSASSPYIGYLQAANEFVAWGTARDGSGGGANYRSYTKTKDGGLTWEAKEISNLGGTAFSMIYGLNADTAYISMWGSSQANNKVLRTQDGGNTWSEVLSGGHSASFFNVVHFFNKNDGFSQGDPDTEFELYTTSDGGDSWTRVNGSNIPDPISGEFGITGMYTAVGDTIWYSTNKGRVYKSIDKGHNWTVATIYTPPAGYDTYVDLAFSMGGLHGLALITITNGTNFSNKHFKTTDGGATWTEITAPTGNFYDADVAAVPGVDNMFYSVGSDFKTPKMGISYTIDGGDTWVELADYYKNFQLLSIDMASAEKGFIGGFAGANTGGAWMFGNKEPVYALFHGEDSVACVNSDFAFTSTSTGDIDAYSWNFGEGATPATATGIGPHTVQYSTPGLKTVSLHVSNAQTSDTKILENYILVADVAPNTIDTITGAVQVQPSSAHIYTVPAQDYTYFNWSASTGMFSLRNSVTDTVIVDFGSLSISGTLSVQAVNGCGVGNKVDLDITIDPNAANLNYLSKDIVISPNPTSDLLSVSGNEKITNIQILTMNGQVVYSNDFDSNNANVNVSNLEKGMYLISITSENETRTEKIVIK